MGARTLATAFSVQVPVRVLVDHTLLAILYLRKGISMLYLDQSNESYK